MSSITLRPYQTKAVETIFDAIEDGYTRLLYTQATGTGKTTTFAELCRIFLEYHSWNVLVLAHRRELITQAYQRIQAHCELTEWEIGIELAETRAAEHNKVVVGSVMTVKNGSRLPVWRPKVIITDEAHRAAAASYAAIYERFGVNDGECIHIGCTATAKRTDRQSLYAINLDGSPVELWDKKKTKRTTADPATSVYQKHVFEYSVLDAVEDGYLVPMRGVSVQTETGLSGVQTDRDGDFKEGQLAKAVDNAQRTLQAISAWKDAAEGRPTIVFCAGVEHAYHAAELWNQAGYRAAALGGEDAQDTYKRAQMLEDFKHGRLQVLCNMGLFTEGTDLPTASCIVHLRPTKSWNLYVQMSGRGSRTLPGVVDGHSDPSVRRGNIAGSAKPDCLIIDLCDLCESNDLCSVPSILDLPAKMDLEGQSLTEVKALLNDFEEVKGQVIGECPMSYSQLKVRLEQVELLRSGKVKSGEDWKATEGGYRFGRTPVGYQGELQRTPDGWFAVVRHAGQEIVRKQARDVDPKTGQPYTHEKFLDSAASFISSAVETHKASLPQPSRGTMGRLTTKQANCLKANGHRAVEIDAMPYAKAKALIDSYMTQWKARTEAPAEEFATA